MVNSVSWDFTDLFGGKSRNSLWLIFALSQEPVVFPNTPWLLCGPRGCCVALGEAGVLKLLVLSGPKSNKSQKTQSREKKNVLIVQFCPKGHLLL